MKHKSVRMYCVLLLLLSAPSLSHAIDVTASAAVSNIYLWRGIDLQGGAAVSGDITASFDNGVYAGVWGSSGDEALGNEYDLYLGWTGDLGVLSFDVSYWTYIYPEVDIDARDIEDFIVSVNYESATITLYEALQDDADEYRYLSFNYNIKKFDLLLGHHDYEKTESASHIQLSYAFNDNLSFAVSKFLDDKDGAYDDNVQFSVSYRLDIK